MPNITELGSGGTGSRVRFLNHEAKISQGYMVTREHRESRLKSRFTPPPELIHRPKQHTGAVEISMG